MKVGVLTSSRADFGIYFPLLNKMKSDPFFRVEAIVFGSHLSKMHGFTVQEVENVGFEKIHKVSSLLSNDDEVSIATSYALTVLKFADFWASNKFDLVLCLGDRFEMSAAVQAGIPYCIQFAHFHGGETTLGAIDNIYRHQITHASTYHFTATNEYSEKVKMLIGKTENVFSVGALSLDRIDLFNPLDKIKFYEKYHILQDRFALVTFHPETVARNENLSYAIEMRKAILQISNLLFVVVTMPNADAMGSIYREQLYLLKNEIPDKIVCIENFGKENYFNAMFYATVLVGNTSSAIIEAASFKKYVINVGDRQKGRVQSGNIINCGFNAIEIFDSLEKAMSLKVYKEQNIYYKENSVDSVIKILKEIYE